jgi:predicted oxidoreductase
MVAAAVDAGAPVRRGGSRDELAAALGFELDAPQLAKPPFAAVQVEATITHTIGGLAIDAEARVLDEAGDPIPGLWAAGVDAGGFSGGGYASGLAQALVTGLAAAESAAGYAGTV